MSQEPLVSIYIPTHNRSLLLRQALESCLAQTYQKIEIIIVDDNSNDDTQSVCLEYTSRYKNIRSYKNNEALGACASRNFAIAHCNGEYVTGLDDDDLMLPHRIKDFVMNINNNYSFLCSTIIEKNPFGEFPARMQKQTICESDMKRKNYVGNQIFIRRQHLLNIGGYDTNMKAWQDFDLWLRLITSSGPALKIDNHSYIVNQSHDFQTITSSDTCGIGFQQFIAKHKALLSKSDIKSLRINDLANRNANISALDIITHLGPNTHSLKLLLVYLKQRFPSFTRAALLTQRMLHRSH